jgi:hypothetical protein
VWSGVFLSLFFTESLTVIMLIIPNPPCPSSLEHPAPLRAPAQLILTHSPNCMHKTNDGSCGLTSAPTAVPWRAAPRLGWVKCKPHESASVLRRGVQLWCVGAEVWEGLWRILFKSKAQRFPQVLTCNPKCKPHPSTTPSWSPPRQPSSTLAHGGPLLHPFRVVLLGCRGL